MYAMKTLSKSGGTENVPTCDILWPIKCNAHAGEAMLKLAWRGGAWRSRFDSRLHTKLGLVDGSPKLTAGNLLFLTRGTRRPRPTEAWFTSSASIFPHDRFAIGDPRSSSPPSAPRGSLLPFCSLRLRSVGLLPPPSLLFLFLIGRSHSTETIVRSEISGGGLLVSLA